MTSITIDNASDLSSALSVVLHAAARADVRPILSSVLVTTGPLGVRLVAADNFRMSIIDIHGTAPGDDLVITAAAGKMLESALRKTIGVATIGRIDQTSRAIAQWQGGSLEFDIVDERYPAFARVVPAGDRPGDVTIGLNARYLVDACKALDARSYNHGVSITFNSDPHLPIVIRPLHDESAVAIVMPISLRQQG